MGPLPLSLRFRTFWTFCGWVWVAAIWYLSLTPQPPQGPGTFLHSDKVYHFLSYFFLTWWFLGLSKKNKIFIPLTFMVMGLLIEIFQSYLPPRTFDGFDGAANTFGCFCGYFLAKKSLYFPVGFLDTLLNQFLKFLKRR